MKRLFSALRHPHDHRWLELRPWRRHSLVLTLGGLIYAGIGWVYVITGTNPARIESLELALNLMPMPGWGLCFITAGTLGILSSRWPPASEKWGYTAMSALASLWGSFYVLGPLFFDGPASGLAGGLVWHLIAFMWWAISGLDNPHDRVQGE